MPKASDELYAVEGLARDLVRYAFTTPGLVGSMISGKRRLK